MAYIRRHVVTVATDALGAGVGYTPAVEGHIHAIQYVKPASGGYDDGVTLAVVGQQTGIAVLALAAGQMNTSRTVYPRVPVQLAADGADLVYTSDNKPVVDRVAVAHERVQLTIASGGDTKVGTFHVYVEG